MKRKGREVDFTEIPRSKKIKTPMATQKLPLTPQEQRLRKLLLDVAGFIDDAKKIEEKIELRFAGGWVRDKLLDIPSHDIDTAINAMTGEDFCLQLQEYCTDPKNLEKHSLGPEDLGSIHIIAANPEKSKHLATATKRILGFDVDFVNLRKETYSVDSRHPQVEFGTAEEDALRRDATINSLFYNLHTDQIEDFCGGLEDIQAKRIRTPLEPLTTFTDDPLRVLRLIRFASRLGFKIDPETEVPMTDPAVSEALKIKISRERVGVEVEKMLKGQNPLNALQLIDRLGLYQFVFTDPTLQEIPVPSTTNWHFAYDCLEVLKSNETPGSIYKSLVRSEDAKFIAWILTAAVPWAKVPLPQSAKPKTKLPLPYGTLVVREGIKATSKVCDVVTGAFRNFVEITGLRDAIKRKDAYVHERDTIGMSIRRWDFQGKNWRLQVLLAILVEAINNGQNSFEGLFSEWQLFIDHLTDMDVMDAPSLKLLVNGDELKAALGGVKPGMWMKPALDVCVEWQLRNPDSCSGSRNFGDPQKSHLATQIIFIYIYIPRNAIEMFASARKAAKSKISSKGISSDEALTLSSQCLPERYSLSQLYDGLELSNESQGKGDDLQNLLILNSCLSNSDRLERENGDAESIERLSLWISKAILPDKILNGQDEVSDASRGTALSLTHHKAALGLESLQILITQISSPRPSTIDPKTIITLITFSSTMDPWTTPAILSLSTSFLSLYTPQTHTQDLILTLLNTFIRPLFSHSKPRTITSSGRKAMPSSAPLPKHDVAAERTSKPWKYETVYAVRVLAWIVENAPGEIIAQNWHLFPPPLLTLLDDASTPFRATGSHLLSAFLPHLSSKLLKQSGIGEVFEDALLPTLLYLPNLTPVDESLRLLSSAYGALSVLCDVRYEVGEKARIEFLDRVMRMGVFMGYHHASEHPAIVQLLLEQTKVLVEKMGIHAVKHLKDLIPILSTTLTDPFAPSNPPLLLSAIRALQTVLLNCWPRISEPKYKMKIIKALSVCWTDVSASEDRGRLEEVQKDLKVAGRLLVSAVGGGVNVRAELRPLVEVNKDVGIMFGVGEGS
ncbi:CCA tRNA nucleotidyltransferase, mitochondrial [Lachnellula occidentalis]|uniref:CCA tRNA nucleotidyltransferase, mitochondrial n=1 Tax=Lachnellula occidentalis TaxID=215460 RepID=A0A8H8RN57_9HELO|nr:CCA tRNA nucleotidyltransferase, mitochondrial [Lachnellula occidentalis]